MASRGPRILYRVAYQYRGYRNKELTDIVLVGVASTFEVTHNFLDIDDTLTFGAVVGGAFIRTKKGGSVADTTIGGDGANDGAFLRTDGEVLQSLGSTIKGGKRIRLQTNKTVVNSQSKAKTKPKYTISFHFPSWATNLVISDLLAELIPDAKFGSGETEIQPYFLSESGRKYPIMSKAQAEASSLDSPRGATVINTPQEEQQLELLTRPDNG